jgi:hypothetical protein
MRFSRRHLLALVLVGSAGLLAFVPGPARAVGEGGDEPEPPRRLPQRLRDDPERYRELKRQWHDFMKLPAERRKRLEAIDEELNDEPPAVRARLWAVMDRYTAWLDHLSPGDRQQVESAPDAAKKLEVIRALRERDWLGHQARAERERIERAAPEERAKLIEHLRQKERDRRAEWEAALRMQEPVVPPRGQPEFWPAVQLYVNKSLIPTLTPDERAELRKAYLRSWPEYAQQLTALAEKHPILVPPGEKPGVTAMKDLPQGYLRSLMVRPGKPRDAEGQKLTNLQGRWPNFALEVVHLAERKKAALPDKPMGPCKPEDFLPGVQRFIGELRKDPAAAQKLDAALNRWPDYPFAVMELAKARGRRVPGTFLPGPPAYWEQAKTGQGE